MHGLYPDSTVVKIHSENRWGEIYKTKSTWIMHDWYRFRFLKQNTEGRCIFIRHSQDPFRKRLGRDLQDKIDLDNAHDW
jgi:hypothetical protein